MSTENERNTEYTLKFTIDVFSEKLISIKLPEDLVNRESGTCVANIIQDIQDALEFEREKYANKKKFLVNELQEGN